MKRFFLIILFIKFFSPIPVNAKEPSQILFINQVRGEECCQKGSLTNLQIQVEAFNKYKIPAYFVLRYDVLKDDKYLNFLKQTILSENIKLGLLLEITPRLAKDSGVKYRGNENNWFEAQNIYSIGYTSEENKKIVDYLFSTFKDVFGYYPKVTSSWMISTETLNYINAKYGVLIHQITKEQYSTDSYTLYGGPPHYPYPASEKWLFIPDYERLNAPLIVRQTITDPLYNYGDNSASFTSQPNDYMRDKKDINYFKRLINQVIDQPTQVGFGLLGLENSMDEVFQKEYLLQIEYIKQLNNEKKIKFLQLKELVNFWKTRKITVYTGADLIHSYDSIASWITTPNYRIRLKIENKRISVTDIRIFNKEYSDPYTKKIAQKEGFWIVPYLIDESHWFDRLEISDYKKNTLKWINQKDSIRLQFENSSGKITSIIFKSTQIIISPVKQKQIKYFESSQDNYPIKYFNNLNEIKLNWEINKKVGHELKMKFNKNEEVINFKVNSNVLDLIREVQYPYLFPEPITREISVDKSKVIVHNRFAIAGRNPIRLVIIPYDIYGIATTGKDLIKVETKPVLQTSDSSENKLNFIDISSENPTKASVIIKIAKKQIKKENIYFAPNCSREFSICLKNPQYLWWYINTVIGDKIRLLINREQQ